MAECVQVPHDVEGRLNAVATEFRAIICPEVYSAGAPNVSAART